LGDLQVTEAQVVSVTADLRAVGEETRSGLSSLDGELSSLLGSGWKGQAGSAFGDVWQRWHEGAEELVRGLDTMAGLLEEAAHGYHQTDSAGGAAIDSSGARISLTLGRHSSAVPARPGQERVLRVKPLTRRKEQRRAYARRVFLIMPSPIRLSSPDEPGASPTSWTISATTFLRARHPMRRARQSRRR
jgi:WXG100 family type VII secretion target